MSAAFWKKFYGRGYASCLVIVLALAYLLKTTWFRWGDLIIDLGREMYVPAKLASGAVLYRDIFYLYGPFPPYFNAFLYKILGANILSLVIGGILVTALTSFLLYKISRFFLNIFFSTFTVLAFLFVLAFGHYVAIGNYNFILPYSYPATHAVLFSLGALYFLFRFLDRGASRDVYGVGICIFLCMISRAEIGVMLALAVLPAIVMMKASGSRVSLFRPLVCFPVAGAFLVYGIFFFIAGPRILQSGLFDVFKSNAQASPFALLLSGVNAPGQNMFLMFKSALFYCLLVAWFALVGYGAARAGRLKHAAGRRALYAIIAAAAALGTFIFLRMVYPFELQYRSMPVIYVIVGVLSALAYVRSGGKPGELKLFILSLFSFLVVMRIILYVHAWHYGFYMLVPGFIVYHAFFFRTLPRLVPGKFMTAAFYAGFTWVLVVLMTEHFQISDALYKRRTLGVPSPRGEISVFADPQGAGVRDLVDFFLHKTPPNATLAVFPEGVAINFLAERESPLYEYSFLPPDIGRAGAEEAVLDDMVLKKPDYVVILQRNVGEYGSRGFGVDYGQKIMACIDRDYVPFAQYGPLPFAPDNFSSVIFKRR